MSTTEGLALYQYQSCPYCRRVRMAIDQLGIEIEMRDTLLNSGYGDEVVAATGRRTVPILQIRDVDGGIRWLPESSDIIAYLQERFA